MTATETETDATEAPAPQTSPPAVEPETVTVKTPAAEPAARRMPARTISVSVSRSTLLKGTVIAGLIGALIAVTVQWRLAADDLHRHAAQAGDDRRAQQVATDYAVGAAKISYDDVPAWTNRLKAGTAPALANKFDATAPKLREILTSLKWTSSATIINAVVTATDGAIVKVNVFLNVTSTSAQTPEGAQTTVTYNVTMDKNAGWQITDVGGMDGALPGK